MFDVRSLALQQLPWDRLDLLFFVFFLPKKQYFNKRSNLAGAAKLPGLAKMTTKVKGLLRGLRYISQIFDEKEQEMQIGLPTDVKHVAHIGWDGPSANAPSWMNEFTSPPEILSGTSNSTDVKNLSTDSTLEVQTEKPKHSSRLSSGSASSLLNSPDRRSTDSSKHSRRQASSSTGSPLNSPSGTDAPKSSRRHRSSNKSMDSPREESSGNSRTSRRHKTSSLGPESPIQDQPTIPKHSRGRKSKGSSRSKEKKNSSNEALPFSDPGPGGSECTHGRKNIASQLSSVLEAYEEER